MKTAVDHVYVRTPSGKKKLHYIRLGDGTLLRNRLHGLLREFPEVSADPQLGEELLEQAKGLYAECISMQDINRTTEAEIIYAKERAKRKIRRNEDTYKAIFGQLPASYLDAVSLLQ